MLIIPPRNNRSSIFTELDTCKASVVSNKVPDAFSSINVPELDQCITRRTDDEVAADSLVSCQYIIFQTRSKIKVNVPLHSRGRNGQLTGVRVHPSYGPTHILLYP